MKKESMPLYGVELYDKNQKPTTEGFENWIQIKSTKKSCFLWQKEALLNIAETLVPDYYQNIAWIDADIEFSDVLWKQKTISLLDTYDIVQLYKKAFWTGKNGEILKCLPAICSLEDKNYPCHAGFAWAMKRKQWDKSKGLYDRCISGGGDGILARSFLGMEMLELHNWGIGSNDKALKEWRSKLDNPSVSYLDCDIYHEYHGEMADRNYTERKIKIKDVDLTCYVNLNKDGIFEWSDDIDKEVIDYAEEYFLKRQEDN